MARDVIIRISATDAASPVFKKIAGEAQAAGATIEQSNQKVGRSYDDLQRKAAAVGAGVGAIVGGVALAGRAFVSQEQQIRALERSYGESADTIIRFTEELQKSTVYSDDAARQSAIYASSLIQNYGLTADQIGIVIERSADLAAVNVTAQGTQIALTDAVSRTSAALRGEAEAGELLGLSMSDTFLKAEAAARGMDGWSTTMTEAEKAQFRFTIMLEQSEYAMGAAAEAADTNAGKARQLVNALQDQWQAFGGATGAAGEYLSVMGDMAIALPFVTGLAGKMAAALGAVGLGGPVIAAGALVAGSAAYAYQLNQQGSGTENKTAGFLSGAAGLVQKVTPGSYGDALFKDIEQQYLDIINSNDFEEAAKLAILQPFERDAAGNREILYERLSYLMGIPTGQMGTDQLQAEAERRAKAGGYQSTGQYILATQAETPAYQQDPNTGVYLSQGVYAVQRRRNARERVQALQDAQTSYVGSPGTSGLAGAVPPTPTGMEFSPGTSGLEGAVGSNPSADALQWATDLAAYRMELEATYGAYAGLVEGMNSAHDAQEAFYATQQNVLQSQGEYTQQISEYTSQESALTNARDLLIERQEAGIELTKQEQGYLEKYPELYERITGGQEDATIQAGFLAAAYVENMKIGDEMNRNLEDSTGSTRDLVSVITELILALDGVPPETRSDILSNAIEAKLDIRAVGAAATDLDGTNATVNVEANTNPFWNAVNAIRGSNVGTVFMDMSPMVGGMPGIMHGGTIGYANGGTVYDPLMPRFANGGTWAMVGEVGPELVKLSRGDQVIPTGASKSMLKGGSGGGGITIQTLNIYPETADLRREITAAVVGDWR